MELKLVKNLFDFNNIFYSNLVFPVALFSNINHESNASGLDTDLENNSPQKHVQLNDYLTMEYIQYDKPCKNLNSLSIPFSNFPGAGKRVAITFDDGPHGYWTNKYIEILEMHKVKATFFLLGSRAELFPDAVENLVKKGFEIGNHSYSHILMKNKKPEIIESEFKKSLEILTNITGEKVKLFRAALWCLR